MFICDNKTKQKAGSTLKTNRIYSSMSFHKLVLTSSDVTEEETHLPNLYRKLQRRRRKEGLVYLICTGNYRKEEEKREEWHHELSHKSLYRCLSLRCHWNPVVVKAILVCTLT